MVPPTVIAGEESIEGIHEIGIGSAAQLHDHESGGGMREEEMQQAVAAASGFPAELGTGAGHVEQAASLAVYLDLTGQHAVPPGQCRAGSAMVAWLPQRKQDSALARMVLPQFAQLSDRSDSHRVQNRAPGGYSRASMGQ